jgi:hypothetical protein
MTLFDRLLKKNPKPVMGSPAANDAVRAQLASFGDDGAATRHVLHYAYPGAAANLDARLEMIRGLRADGFAVKDAAAANGLVLEHYRAVAPDDFDKVTAELSAWFAERGWEYDGWECAVAQTARP